MSWGGLGGVLRLVWAVLPGFGLAVCWGGLAVCLMPGRGGLGLGGAV